MNQAASNLADRNTLRGAVQNETFIGQMKRIKEVMLYQKAGLLLQGRFPLEDGGGLLGKMMSKSLLSVFRCQTEIWRQSYGGERNSGSISFSGKGGVQQTSASRTMPPTFYFFFLPKSAWVEPPLLH